MSRIDRTWESLLCCQEGSKTSSDGLPAMSSEEAKDYDRVKMINECGIEKNDNILEIGSGGGGLIKTLNNIGYNSITGVTFGEGNINNAKREYGIELERMDMHFMSFPNESFDAVIGFSVFEHTPAPILLGIEINRVLKFGGKVLICVPSGEFHFKHDNNVHHLSTFDGWQLSNTFRKCGFINLQVKETERVSPDNDGLYGNHIILYGTKGNNSSDLSLHLRDIANGKFLT